MDYTTLATPEAIAESIVALKERNIGAEYVANRAEALTKVRSMIPAGASVMNGSSLTLEQIGFVDYLKADRHGWNNLHAAIVAEQDPQKQSVLRQQSILADYFLGSVHAIAETGELVIASNTGSQLPAYIFSSPNVIWVAGSHKIVPTLKDALRRLREYVLPLEDKHMKEKGYPGSSIGKVVIFERETPFLKRHLTLILVNEQLGF